MDVVKIYECFCDVTRLRMLNLLSRGPLCVCHLQEILELPQVKVSQHLAYLRKRGLVEVSRRGTWRIYRLPARRPAELASNLACLQDCMQADKRFRADLRRLAAIEAGRLPVTESAVFPR